MSTERTETCVELNVGVAKKRMAVIRDTAMLIADSNNPDDIGYALHENHNLALRWKSVEGFRICVDERVYKRKPRHPKNGKKREVAISDGTRTLLK
jgi:hypothetical protein